MLRKLYYLFAAPLVIGLIVSSTQVHRAHRMPFWRRYRLGLRMLWNTTHVQTGTSFKTHLVMAMKLFELPPDAPGVVVECGTWNGGTAVNLSLVCRLTGRRLLVFDSFQGLPAEMLPHERACYQPGDYCGTLEDVRRTITRLGAIEVCDFVPGWFQDTLPSLDRSVALAYVDVDLQQSLQTCVVGLWPHLNAQGYLFIDEVQGLNYCALFFSERWWSEHFQRDPPGLIGAGIGLALGDVYYGPLDEVAAHPHQYSCAGAYTRKDFECVWRL